MLIIPHGCLEKKNTFLYNNLSKASLIGDNLKPVNDFQNICKIYNLIKIHRIIIVSTCPPYVNTSLNFGYFLNFNSTNLSNFRVIQMVEELEIYFYSTSYPLQNIKCTSAQCLYMH